MDVSISPGNIKLGAIKSVSLPAYKTCLKDAPCYKDCYAAKISRLRKTVNDAYERNYRILRSDPDIYFNAVDEAIASSDYFRFHVSGDIVDDEYFARMVDVAERHSNCEILCFTKKYDIVNQWLDDGLTIPDNLHIIFSVWRNLDCNNPYNLPEAHVKYKDGHTTAKTNAILCKGNCTNCAKTNEGCWVLKRGEQIVFKQH